MKKRLFVSFLILAVASINLHARDFVVSSTLDFRITWLTLMDGDTISVTPNDGMIYNLGDLKLKTSGGCLTIRSTTPDSLPYLQLSVTGVMLNDTTTCGLVFENLHLEYRSPLSTSGQIVYFNSVRANISKLVFKGCEITQSIRSLFRSVKPNLAIINPTTGLPYNNCGILNYFEMSNCIVHNSFLSQYNNWPMVYSGHIPEVVNFKNNSFYDMPYLKNIFSMGIVNNDWNTKATINFENNTVCISGPYNGQSLISTGAFLHPETVFNIKNNVLLLPNWVDAKNIRDTSFLAPKVLSSSYGIVNASHNLIQGYNSWASGEAPDSLGAGRFIFIDTIPQYDMASLGVKWSDFANPLAGNYSYLSSNPMATAGTNGGPIGDPKWVVGLMPKNLLVTANISGAILTPTNGSYQINTPVKVSASTVIGYRFNCWTDSLGNVVSQLNPYEFSIISDTKLMAQYDTLPTRNVVVNIKGSKTGTYSISPVRTTYYEGDYITITVNDHAVNDFVAWNDGSNEKTRYELLGTENLVLDAYFIEKPYFLAWDFCQIKSSVSYSYLYANHWADTTNMGMMKAITKDSVEINIKARYNKFMESGSRNCVLRYTTASNFARPDWVYVKFNTAGKSHVKVRSQVGVDICAFKKQLMQYSLDKVQWTTFSSFSFSNNIYDSYGKWTDFDGILPESVNNRDSVFVRWIGDAQSGMVSDSTIIQSYENFYISNVVISTDSTFNPDPVTSKLYTEPVTVASGTVFSLPLLAELPSDSIISYQFDMYYDTNMVEYLGIEQENTLSDQSLVLVNSNEIGRIKVAYTSTNYLNGSGILLTVKFRALNVGKCVPTIPICYFNSNLVGDVQLSTITVTNKYGDVNGDNLILAHDAGLVLQYSVGMDPLPTVDPLPWESWRLMAADVDGSKDLNAFDAGLILQRSIDLIQFFPVEAIPTTLRSAKVEAINNVTITQEGQQLVFRSYGSIIGLNVDIKNGSTVLLEPKNIAPGMLSAKNISGKTYRIGLATSTPMVDGTVLMVMPIKDNASSELTFSLIVNNEYQDLKAKIVTGQSGVSNVTPTICPNPVGDIMQVKGLEGVARIIVTDLNGRVLLNKEIVNGEDIQANKLSGGVYLYKIQVGDITHYGKLLKK